MKRTWPILVAVVLLLIGFAGSVDAQGMGNCPMDPNGYTVCGQQCNYDNTCISGDYPITHYCYVYFEPPGCWHDGTDEPCCAKKHSL